MNEQSTDDAVGRWNWRPTCPRPLKCFNRNNRKPQTKRSQLDYPLWSKLPTKRELSKQIRYEQQRQNPAYPNSIFTAPEQTRVEQGLVFLETQTGEGDAPHWKDKVKVHYEGRLVDGTVFDSSIQRGEPIEFALGGVIRGWTEGLQLMKPGSKAKLTIPADLAYGDGGQGPIPGKAVLVFDVELIAIV